jgi:hypothetical protein
LVNQFKGHAAGIKTTIDAVDDLDRGHFLLRFLTDESIVVLFLISVKWQTDHNCGSGYGHHG